MASDAMSSIQAAISEKPLIYQCPCGLMEIAIPIIVNGTYLGGFLCGQARCSDPPEDILQMKPVADLDLFYQTLFESDAEMKNLPVFSYQTFESVADLVHLVITLLCENKISALEHEKSLRDQLRRTSFLETHTQIFLQNLQGTDYRSLLQNISLFVSKLYQLIPEKASAQEQILSSLSHRLEHHLDIIHPINCLERFPLQAADIQTACAAKLWLTEIMDFFFCQNKQKSFAILGRVFQYIDQHITKKLSLSLLVEQCNISQSYLSRLFRTCFELSVTDYIHLRKLHLAKQMMLRGKHSSADIAFALGYNEYTYFCKIFKKYEGITIQEYTKKYRNHGIISV